MQELGSDFLVHLDGLERSKKEEAQMLSTLVASGRFEPTILPGFPTDEEEREDMGEDVEYDYSGVQWALPSDLDDTEMDDLRKAMAEHGTVDVSEPFTEDDLGEMTLNPASQATDVGEPDDDREWL